MTPLSSTVLVILPLLLSGCCHVAVTDTNDTAKVYTDNATQSEAAFSQLKQLEGAWKRSGDDGSHFQIVFSTTARDSVLVETWKRGEDTHSLTLYHRDENGLLATHYCPQGNQPRLRMQPSETDSIIAFQFQDSTNLPSMDNNHQHTLSFEFSDADNTVTRRESYQGKEGVEHATLLLERLP